MISMSPHFSNIKNLNLNQIVKDGENSITSYQNTYKEIKIKDGLGEENIPLIVKNLNTTVIEI